MAGQCLRPGPCSTGVWNKNPFNVQQRRTTAGRAGRASCRTAVLCFKGQNELDVSAATISPYYRSVPRDSSSSRTKVTLLFLGESNVCRSPLAEALMRDALANAGLADLVECQSKGTRDYQVGEGPDPTAVEVAKQLKLELPEHFAARFFSPEQDIVDFDLLLVMDKYTAADALREVAGYDLVDQEANFSSKVRLLGQFHPRLSKRTEPDGQDIDDPLYGNMGGPEDQAAVMDAAQLIEEACLGLVQYLKEQQAAAEAEQVAFAVHVRQNVRNLKHIDWLVPPMLQGRTTPPVPFI